MGEYKASGKEKKRKRKIELEEIYRLLELIYRKLGEGRYRSRLGKLGPSYRGGPLKLNPKLNPKLYEGSRGYAKPEPKYGPKPEKISYGGGKPWSEPAIYRPRERLVYDPEVKSLLQKIEKHLTKVLPGAGEQDAELQGLDKLDVEELTKILEKSKDQEVLKKLLEKELAEINELEPEPELYELDSLEKQKIEPVESGEQKLGEAKEEPSDLEELLEKEGKEQGMSILGPFEIDEAEFDWLVEELKRRGAVSGEEWEKIQQGEVSEESEPLLAGERQSVAEPLAEELETVNPEIKPGVFESAEIEAKPEVEPALEPMESELFDVKADIFPEDLDDPVFWQKLENEIVETDFKKLESKPEPEPLDERVLTP